MKTTISLLIAACFMNIVQCQIDKNNKYNLVIGTYTSATNKDGIHVYEFTARQVILTLSQRHRKWRIRHI